MSVDGHQVSIQFRTKYSTYPGQELFVIGDHPLLGCWSRLNALRMTYNENYGDSYNWEVNIRIQTPDSQPVRLEYKYIVLTSCQDPSDKTPHDVRTEKEAEICWDTGSNRSIIVCNPDMTPMEISTYDLFQPPITMIQHIYFKLPFTSVVYSHNFDQKDSIVMPHRKPNTIQFHLRVIAIQIPPDCKVYVTGQHEFFHYWGKFFELKPLNSIYWEFILELPEDTPPFEYKYLIVKEGSQEWEERTNRRLQCPPNNANIVINHDWLYQSTPKNFKGAGILVALFSIHSKQTLTPIGEFMDIMKLVDWAVKANMLLIQLLPMQDNNVTFLKNESPYRQISAFAFNPMYLTLRCIEGYEEGEVPARLDFIGVTQFKLQKLDYIFNNKVDKNALRQDKNFIDFVENNSIWLLSYCYWCAHRGISLSNDPNSIPTWPAYDSIQIPDILTCTLEGINNACLKYAWIQYQCHMQLTVVSQYAVSQRVILACTITIGQSNESVDSWAHPELFDKNYTIGAPPDIFSFHGQNWFYPAWNWDEMAKDDYDWLRQQLGHMEKYFYACLFDHPLGLFRCWNIPSNTNNPLFGHFVPSLPIDIKDLHDLQIRDISRLCRPLFPINDVISFALPEPTKEKLINSLATCENGTWRFRAKFESDRDIIAVLKEFKKGCSLNDQLQFALAKRILLSHFESVCLIPDYKEPHRKYYPRYSMTDSTVFKSLPERDAQVLYKLFVDFYYRTNIGLWHEHGHRKLAILASSQMQLFGYDLGVTLNDEEKALHRVGICSFHVQRIPRESTTRFDLPSQFPYLSVCTPTPHDMQHLSLWWKNEQADVQQFYHQILKMDGSAPFRLNPKIAEGILKLHLNSNSMWCLHVFEDLFSLSDEEPIGKLAENSKWINDPSKHNQWSYRINIDLEDLIEKHEEWTNNVARMIEESNRGRNANPIK